MANIELGTLQKELAELERELLHLKTSSKITSMLNVYTASKHLELDVFYEITVQYAEGNTPLITECYVSEGGQVMPATPIGNTQKIYLGEYAEQTLTIVSTRPILSIG